MVLAVNVTGLQDQNFSLFNYVAEQSNEIERLEDQVAALKAEEMKHGEELGDDATQVCVHVSVSVSVSVCLCLRACVCSSLFVV